MTDQIPPIPKGIGGADTVLLVTAINDRLRRIDTALGAQAPAVPAGKPVTFGTHGKRVGLPVPADGALDSETDRGGVIYRVDGTVWRYLAGEYEDAYAKLPTDLGKNDIGFRFSDTTHWRRFEWAATGGAPSNASPGWRRQPGEMPTGLISVLPLGPGQMAGGWEFCDGRAVLVTQDDATTATVTLPDFSTGAYPKGDLLSNYTGLVNAPVKPTLGGKTDNAVTGITEAQTPKATGTATPGGGGITDPGHFHTLTPANAPIALPGDPVRNVAVPWYMKT
jgi:hypothetical protein